MAGKWLQRREYFWQLIYSIFPFVFNVVLIYAGTVYKNFPPVVTLVLAFSLVITLLIALFRGGRILGRLVAPLDPVQRSFKNLYSALTYNDPEPGEKYGPQVQEAIHKLMQSVSYQLGDYDTPGILLGDEEDELIKNLRDNISKRLVPAARDGELSPDSMRQLAKLLAKPSIDKLRKLNSDIGSAYTEKKKESIEIVAQVARFFSGNRGEITRSLVFGFGVTLFSSAVYTILTQQDFAVFAKDNPAVILGGAFALTVGYLTYLTKA
jgi:hypothetical protein